MSTHLGVLCRFAVLARRASSSVRGRIMPWALLLTLGCAGTDAARGGTELHKRTRGHLGIIFKTVDEAARAACEYVWKYHPRASRVEYCGVIYRDAEGIKAGLPETNDLSGHCFIPIEPEGATAEAGYHNHKQTEDFSARDKKSDTTLALYLCTPEGVVKRLTPEGTVIVK